VEHGRLLLIFHSNLLLHQSMRMLSFNEVVQIEGEEGQEPEYRQ
jgi:hypothetical protein